MDNLLGIIVAAMGVAVALHIFFTRLKLPSILGYILTGTVMVYLFDLHQAAHSHVLSEIAEFGIVFLMFMIGLEFSPEKIRSMRKEVMLFGVLQVVASGALFFSLAHWGFGVGIKTSLIIASAFSLSSTAIVLKSFHESRQIQTPHGKNVLGILIFQDIAVIPILLMITLMSDSSQSSQSLLLTTFVSAVVVLFVLLVPGRRLISSMLRLAANTRQEEAFLGAILFIVMGSAFLAHLFGFSYSLGAFLAGMIIAETRYKYQVEADLQNFRDLLLGVFFITVGMQVNLGYLFENVATVLGLLGGTLLLKTLIIYGAIRMFDSRDTSVKTAIALSQVGEFSFAIFELSRGHGLLPESLHQALVLAVIFSMVMTPFILQNLKRIADLVAKEVPHTAPMRSVGELHDHVIVCGYGSFGSQVVEFLKLHDIVHAVVDYNLERVEEGIRRGENIFFGNVAQKSILDKLHVKEAVSVIVAIDDPHKLRLVCESILERAPESHIIVKVASDQDMELIQDLEVHRIINEQMEIAKQLALAAISSNFSRIKRKQKGE